MALYPRTHIAPDPLSTAYARVSSVATSNLPLFCKRLTRFSRSCSSPFMPVNGFMYIDFTCDSCVVCPHAGNSNPSSRATHPVAVIAAAVLRCMFPFSIHFPLTSFTSDWPYFLQFQMQSQRRHKHRPAHRVVSRIHNELQVRPGIESTPDVRRVITRDASFAP